MRISLTPSPTGATSSEFPSARRSIRVAILALARASRSLCSQVENSSGLANLGHNVAYTLQCREGQAKSLNAAFQPFGHTCAYLSRHNARCWRRRIAGLQHDPEGRNRFSVRTSDRSAGLHIIHSEGPGAAAATSGAALSARTLLAEMASTVSSSTMRSTE